ncbi:aspartate kinase [Candidatus Poribacteria bacterium]|nr:aspartate kinase [Candidatus Poribacteria bacterium]
MALIVQKFGGTSVANAERIKNVAGRVARTRSEGNNLIVVVSAMGEMTDELVDLAHQITDAPDEREYDMLLSTGEQISVALLAMALHTLGQEAISFTGAQVGIRTDGWHTKARIVSIETERIQKELNAGRIAIVCGFQGVDSEFNITTLGRGGSDTSAVALAAAFSADLCEIYTDVDGVYTADPRIVPEARKLPMISYDELLEMASLGAQVMQPRAVEFGKKYGVPMRIRSSFNDDPGTLVTKEVASMEKVVVSGVSLNEKEAKITLVGVPDKPGVAAQIFEKIGSANVVVDMIIQNVSENGLSDISFTVPRDDVKRAIGVCEKIRADLGAKQIRADEKVAKVSAVGVGMRGHSGVAAKMFKALADEGVNIEMISTSEIKISCVVGADRGRDALRAIHKAFDLDKAAAMIEG